MPIEIEGPDGNVHTFADGTPTATIQSTLASKYGGPSAKGLPPAGAATPTGGALMPGSQTVPEYMGAEDMEQLLMAKVLGGPRGVASALTQTPGHVYRVEQGKKLAAQNATTEASQRAGIKILRSYAQLLDKFNSADDTVLKGAIGPRNIAQVAEKTPAMFNIPGTSWPNIPIPFTEAATTFDPKTNAPIAGPLTQVEREAILKPNDPRIAAAWNLQNLFSHDVHGIINAFMTNAGSGLNMSDDRQKAFDATMRDFMRATSRESAKEILDHAKGIITNDFGLSPAQANAVIQAHLLDIAKERASLSLNAPAAPRHRETVRNKATGAMETLEWDGQQWKKVP